MYSKSSVTYIGLTHNPIFNQSFLFVVIFSERKLASEIKCETINRSTVDKFIECFCSPSNKGYIPTFLAKKHALKYIKLLRRMYNFKLNPQYFLAKINLKYLSAYHPAIMNTAFNFSSPRVIYHYLASYQREVLDRFTVIVFTETIPSKAFYPQERYFLSSEMNWIKFSLHDYTKGAISFSHLQATHHDFNKMNYYYTKGWYDTTCDCLYGCISLLCIDGIVV